MVTHGSGLKNKFVAATVAASLVLPPAKDVFGQDRRLAVNTSTTQPQTVVPTTVTLGNLPLTVLTLDRSVATTDMMSAAYRTCTFCNERWRDRSDGSEQTTHPTNSLAYYQNAVKIAETGGADGLRALFNNDRNTNTTQFGIVYTGTNAAGETGDVGANYTVNDFASAYRSATGRDLRRVRMIVQHGQNSRGEEQYVVMAVAANDRGEIVRQNLSGITGCPAVAMAYYPNREGRKTGSAMYIFIRD